MDVSEGPARIQQGLQLAYDFETKTLRAMFDQETGMGMLRMERAESGELLLDMPLAGASFELVLTDLPDGLYRFTLKHVLGGTDSVTWRLP